MRVTPRYHYLPEDQALIKSLKAYNTSSGTGQSQAAAANPASLLDLLTRREALGPQVFVNEEGLMVYATRLITTKDANNPFHDEETYLALINPISGATVHGWIWAEDFQTRHELIWTDELIEQHLAGLIESEKGAWFHQGAKENPMVWR